jgi:hypothetical protein
MSLQTAIHRPYTVDSLRRASYPPTELTEGEREGTGNGTMLPEAEAYLENSETESRLSCDDKHLRLLCT